jgi:predicted small lipoprotein YifL
MDHLNRIVPKEKKIKLTTVRKFSLFLFCLLLGAYCLLFACGKKGPPTLKSNDIASPPAQSESVDSNNVESIPEKPSTEKQ